MGLKRCCGSLEPFAAILDEFQQRCAFGGIFRNPNIGVFQQNTPFVPFHSMFLMSAKRGGFSYPGTLCKYADLPY